MENNFRCAYCGTIFDKPNTVVMKHGLDTPPYETWQVCPTCKEPVYIEGYVECTKCGVKMLVGTEMAVVGENKYCPDCYEIKNVL